MTHANVLLRLDRVTLSRLAALEYLALGECDPGAVRDAVWAALGAALSTRPATPVRHVGV